MSGGVSGHELATAYVAVVPSMKGVTSGIGKEFEGVAKGLSKQVDVIPGMFRDTFKKAGKIVGTSISGINETTAKMIGSVSRGVGTIVSDMGRIAAGVDASETAIGRVTTRTKKMFSSVPSSLTPGIQAIGRFKDGFFSAEAAASVFSGRMGTLGGKTRRVFTDMRAAGINAGVGMRDTFDTVRLKGMYAVDSLRGRFPKLFSAASKVATTIRNSFSTAFGAVTTSFASISTAAANAFPNTARRIHSVRDAFNGVKTATKNAINVVPNFIAGISSSKAAASALTGVAGTLGGRFRDGFSNAGAAASVFSGRMGTLGGVTRKVFDGARTAANAVRGGFDTLALKGMYAADKIGVSWNRFSGTIERAFPGVVGKMGGLAKTAVGKVAGVVGKGAGAVITGFGKLAGSVLTSGTKILGQVTKVVSGTVKQITNMLKGPATLAIVGGTAAIVSAMTKGLKRLNTIDTARAKMRGIGIEGKEAARIMNVANASVLGTTHTLDEAATVAQGAVAAGINSGKELQDVMNTISNTASATNRPLEEIGHIFNSVAGTQQAYTAQINQIARSGIPMWKNLAEVMGMTQSEVKDAVRGGAVGFEEFRKAAEMSVGSIAGEMGRTLPGALKNFGASISRVGANIWKGFEPEDGVYTGLYSKLAPLIIALTDAMKPLEKVAAQVGETLGQKVGPVLDWVTKKLEAFKKATEVFVKPADDLTKTTKSMGDNFSGLFEVIKPFGAMFLALGASGVGPLLQVFGRFRPLLGPIPAILGAVGSSAGIAFAGLYTLSKVDPGVLRTGFTNLVKEMPAMFEKLLTGFAKFGYEMLPEMMNGIIVNLPILLNGIQRIISEAAKIFGSRGSMVQKIFENIVETILKTIETLLPHLVSFITKAIPQLVNILISMVPVLLSAAMDMFMTLVKSVQAIFPALVDMLVTILKDIVVMIVDFAPDLLVGAVDLFMGIVNAIPDIINPLFDAVVELLPVITGALISVVPQLVEAAITLFNSLLEAIGVVLPSIINSLMDMVPALVELLITLVPVLLEGAITLFTALVSAITEILPDLIVSLIELIMNVATMLIEQLPILLESGIELFMGLVEAVTEILPDLITAIVELLPVIIETVISLLPELLGAAIELFMGIVQALPEILPALIEATIGLLPVIAETLIRMLPELIMAAIELFMGLVLSLAEILPSLIGAVIETILSVIASIATMLVKMLGAGVELFMQLVLAIPSVAIKLWEKLKEFGGELIEKVKNLGPEMLAAGKEIITGLIDGIKEKMSGAVDAVKDVGKNIVGGFKNLLGIKSPSKVFAKAGEALTQGVAKGVGNGSDAVKAVSDMAKSVTTPVVMMEKAFTALSKVIAGQVKVILGLIKTLVGNASKLLISGFDTPVRKVGDMFKRVLPKAITDSVKIMTATLRTFSDWVERRLGVSIANAMSGVQTSFQKILSPISTAITKLRSVMNDFQGWATRVFAKSLGTMLDGITGKWKTHPTSVQTQLTLTKTRMESYQKWTTDTFKTRIISAIESIETAFKVMPGRVATAWDSMRSATAKPTNYVIGTVYMQGIRTAVSAISKAVGVDMKMPRVSTVSYARGTASAVLPGYSPGVDNYTFYNPKLGFLRLGGGEAILRPEVTRALGGAPTINAWNRSRGRNVGKVGDRGYATGGIIDFLEKGTNGGWTVNTSSKDFMLKFLKDTTKSMKTLVATPAKNAVQNISGGEYGYNTGQIMAKTAAKIPPIFNKKTDKYLGPSTGLPGAAAKAIGVPYIWGGSSIPPGLDCSGLVYWAFQQMGKDMPRLTAAGYQARAVPVTQPRMGDLAFWGYPAHHVGIMSGVNRMIHAPQPGTTVTEAALYGSPTFGRLLYDAGGWLMPGLNLIENKSGAPEPVFSSDQWDVLSRGSGFPEYVQLVDENGEVWAKLKTEVGNVFEANGSARSLFGVGG